MVSLVLFARLVFMAMAFSLLLANSNGMTIPDDKIEKRSGKFLAMNFKIERGTNRTITTHTDVNKGAVMRLPSKTSKRSVKPVMDPLANKETYYLSDLQIGSDHQNVSVQLDTGSSDLWVVSSDVECSDDCTSLGDFDSSSSSSFKDLNTTFKITYGDGSYATGLYCVDDVSFANVDASVTGLQFGNVDKTTAGFGILGIGLTSLESTSNTYPNLPALLAKQGVISKNAYSLYLSSTDAIQGSILFGGVDKAKYTGSLTKFPVTSGSDYLSIQLRSATYGSTTASVNKPALLDSGTTLTYISSDTFHELGKAFNGTYNIGAGVYVINCDQSDSPDLTYNFDKNFTISVPASNLVSKLQYNDGSDAGCFLGILELNDLTILGDNFLRSAYVVYDLEERTISMAPVKYTLDSDISAL